MVMVEYIGQNGGSTSWFGTVTGTHYRFGPQRRIGYVYESDVDNLLAARQGRHAQFQHHVPPKPVVTLSPVEQALKRMESIVSLQWPEEAAGLYQVAMQAPAGLPIVELGTAQGYTAGLMAIAGELVGCHITTIDNYQPMEKVIAHIGPDAVRSNLATLGLDVTVLQAELAHGTGEHRDRGPALPGLDALARSYHGGAGGLAATRSSWRDCRLPRLRRKRSRGQADNR